MAKTQWEELSRRLDFSEQKRAFLQKRLSAGSIEEDSTVWSFVDLMTLLLILFILFYSHALNRRASANDLPGAPAQVSEAQSLQSRNTPIAPEPAACDRPENDLPSAPAQVSEAQTLHSLNTPIDSEPVSDPQLESKQHESKTEDENRDESLEQLQQQVLLSLSKEIQSDFSIHWNQKRLVLVLGERIAFNVGEANLLPDFQPTLARIAGFISSQEGYKIAVAGHTDDAPINTAQFPSNWELSAIRAINVAKFMISHGVDPRRVSIEGYSAYHPLHPNTTSDNKRANRRVEITLIKEAEFEKTTEEVGLSLQ